MFGLPLVYRRVVAREEGIGNSIAVVIATSVLTAVVIATSVLIPVAVDLAREAIGILGNGSEDRNVEVGKYF